MRSILKSTVLSTALTTLIAASLPMAAKAAPNVLLVLADDMGADVSPCHADATDLVRMPTLKSLCTQGMVFNNAHAYPTCSPTRASIITGLYANRTGVGAPVGSENGELSHNTPTLFDHLSQQGYASALIGKWHLSSSRQAGGHPARLGVSYHYGALGGGVRDYENWRGYENGKQRQVALYSTTALTQKAQSWIAEQSKPWFLWLAYNAPHAPFHAPPEELHSFGTLNPEPQRRSDVRSHYFAALQALDTELGNLLNGMSKPVRQNTVVIFVGDNGTPGQVSRRLGLTKDAKGSIYQGGTHVPLVVNGPGVSSGHNDDPVQVTDLFDTILNLAGAIVGTADSFNLVPALKGGSSARTATFIEHFSKSEGRGNPVYGWTIQDGRYALVAPEGKEPELFDMSKDTKQSRNLAQSHSAEVARLTALKAQMLAQ